jgi:diguanylate cyclase (GGDEF)-like protein
VIVLTGFDDDRTATISIQRGMQDYLVKKMINSDALYKSIRYAIARQRMITLLFNMSMVDELTKLYNRRGFYKLAEHDMNMAKRKGLWLSISFIDIDGMKDINDSFGHIEGDRALLDVADILRMTFRESDVIARIGGDEFAAVGLSDNPIDAKVLKERLNQCANKLLEQEKRPYRLSLSIGVASHFSNQLFNLEKLMLEADQFMYQDKQQRDKLTILR